MTEQQLIMDILDEIYNHPEKYDSDRVRIAIGLWDTAPVPYTIYAVLTDQDGYALYGESSYGSDTIEEALGLLLGEMKA